MKIYHNPRCSKSRETLALLREHNIEPEIIEYLTVGVTSKELELLIKKLKVTPLDIVRTNENEWKKLELTDFSEEAVVTAIVECPKLLQRPIVVDGNLAVIGRPPENVLQLIK